MPTDESAASPIDGRWASGRGRALEGVRTLVIGASSGIGEAFARAAHAQGARLAVAARRLDRLTSLATELDAHAHMLDISDFPAVGRVVGDVADELGGLDAVVLTSVVVPLARIEHVDAATWAHAFAVNAIGPAIALREALPHLSSNATIVVTSSHDVGRPSPGVSAYSASKAALDEIIASWRTEHPDLGVVRVAVGPTDDTEILRGADRDLLGELLEGWHGDRHGRTEMSSAADVAATMVSVIVAARTHPSVLPEVVRLAPRSPRDG